MKIEQTRAFKPVVITLETLEEVQEVLSYINAPAGERGPYNGVEAKDLPDTIGDDLFDELDAIYLREVYDET